MKQMKVLIAGLGSAGQRHAQNLHDLGHELLAYRVRGDPFQLVFPEYRDLGRALDQRPDVVFVTNPTSLHLPVALTAAKRGCHLFIEKPLSHTLEGVAELKTAVRARGLTAMVGCQLRFHPLLIQARQLLQDGAIGRVVSARIHAGEYLPDWHPDEDYRQGYSARQDLGGGVILTVIHELDYAQWLFGEVERVTAVVAHRSALEIDVEDNADVILETVSGAAVHVHLDYLQRPPARGMTVIGEGGTLEWDYYAGSLRWWRASAGRWESVQQPVDHEQMRTQLFIDELKHFLDCIERGVEPRIPLSEGERALDLALKAKRSAASGRAEQVTAPAEAGAQ